MDYLVEYNVGMATQIREQKMFFFSSTVGETTYSFNIPANTQAEACRKLEAALTSVIEDVKAMQKPGPN
jgi:hypothetical protein